MTEKEFKAHLQRIEDATEEIAEEFRKIDRGYDAILRIAKEGRGASSKLEDIIEAVEYQKEELRAVLEGGGDDDTRGN